MHNYGTCCAHGGYKKEGHKQVCKEAKLVLVKRAFSCQVHRPPSPSRCPVTLSADSVLVRCLVTRRGLQSARPRVSKAAEDALLQCCQCTAGGCGCAVLEYITSLTLFSTHLLPY